MAAPTPTATEAPGAPVTRNNRRTRWFHTALYLVTTVLLATGWWLRAGREGRPSPLADAVGHPDVEIHRQAGWALAALLAAGVTLGARAAWTFLRETLRFDPGDGRWLRRWPVGAATGRFARHRGHFDPGQRIANLVFAGSLGTLVASGVALTTLSGGPTFATLVRVHRAATYVLTAAVVGHVVVASGVLPGYRGAWRAMHLRGRVPAATARRLWPSSLAEPPPEPADRDAPRGSEPRDGTGPGGHW